MAYEVVLEEFQGPLDLLLHLVKEKEMDLETLEISVIADQYLTYIENMDPDRLEEMSEYLVMASSLIEMKSKLLIPKEELKINDEYQEDPRDALIKRLIEYKRYKDVLEDIREKYEDRQKLYIKPVSSFEEYEVDTSTMIPEGLEIYDLMRAMQKMYQRKILSKPLDTHITRKEVSIDDRIAEIRSFFQRRVNKRVQFEDLFESHDKGYMIVTFLSILTLAKDKEVEIIQDGLFDTIYVEGKLNG